MKVRYSTTTLKSLGFNEQEIRLIQSRNKEYGKEKVLTLDKAMMNSLRYEGLSEIDKMGAESFQQEFGHITEPWTYRKRK